MEIVKMTKTFKESFARYEHPFDFVMETVKQIRKLKSDFGVGCKPIESATVQITNDENKLAVILASAKGIKYQCKCDSLSVNYYDENNSENNLTFNF